MDEIILVISFLMVILYCLQLLSEGAAFFCVLSPPFLGLYSHLIVPRDFDVDSMKPLLPLAAVSFPMLMAFCHACTKQRELAWLASTVTVWMGVFFIQFYAIGDILHHLGDHWGWIMCNILAVGITFSGLVAGFSRSFGNVFWGSKTVYEQKIDKYKLYRLSKIAWSVSLDTPSELPKPQYTVDPRAVSTTYLLGLINLMIERLTLQLGYPLLVILIWACLSGERRAGCQVDEEMRSSEVSEPEKRDYKSWKIES